MIKKTVALVATLALAGLCLAEVKITGEGKAKAYRLVRLQADGDVKGAALIWDVSDEGRLDVEEVGQRLILTGPPGTYSVKLRAIRLKDGVTEVETARATVTIGDAPAPGPGPGPTPGPTPQPEPGPAPSPAPISEPGLRVLVVYETGDLAKYPAGTRAILYGKAVRDYLNSKATTDADGKTRAYRFYDRDVNTSADFKTWQEAMKRPRKSHPWVLISNGRTGFEGPLPASPQEFIDMVKKYAE